MGAPLALSCDGIALSCDGSPAMAVFLGWTETSLKVWSSAPDLSKDKYKRNNGYQNLFLGMPFYLILGRQLLDSSGTCLLVVETRLLLLVHLENVKIDELVAAE
jgi:hypothetical protein